MILLEGTTTSVLLSLNGDIVSEKVKTNMIFKKDKYKIGKTQRQRNR